MCHINYKLARLKGPFILVNPKKISRTCPECAYITKENGPTKSIFEDKEDAKNFLC
jgi:transposase